MNNTVELTGRIKGVRKVVKGEWSIVLGNLIQRDFDDNCIVNIPLVVKDKDLQNKVDDLATVSELKDNGKTSRSTEKEFKIIGRLVTNFDRRPAIMVEGAGQVRRQPQVQMEVTAVESLQAHQERSQCSHWLLSFQCPEVATTVV